MNLVSASPSETCAGPERFYLRNNQRGLKSTRHEAGIQMPEEYELHRFHNWIRERTGGHAA